MDHNGQAAGKLMITLSLRLYERDVGWDDPPNLRNSQNLWPTSCAFGVSSRIGYTFSFSATDQKAAGWLRLDAVVPDCDLSITTAAFE
jgi:hypothetical protein